MKKLFTTYKYKIRNTKHSTKQLKSRLLSKEKLKYKNRLKSGTPTKKKERKFKIRNHREELKPIVYAPSDLRLIKNTEECLSFFKE